VICDLAIAVAVIRAMDGRSGVVFAIFDRDSAKGDACGVAELQFSPRRAVV